MFSHTSLHITDNKETNWWTLQQ